MATHTLHHVRHGARTMTRWRALTLRTRRIVIAGVTLALTFGTLVAVSPAFGATKVVNYVDANGVTQSVTATVIDSSTSGTGTSGKAGWYVCDSTLSRGPLKFFDWHDVNLILADSCNLTLTSTSRYVDGLHVGNSSWTFNLYGQSGNTGRIQATGGNQGAGIYVPSGTVFNMYGGNTSAFGGDGSAGIGGAEGYGGGAINIKQRANVIAMGGKSHLAGGGAGIGGGGSSNGSKLWADGVSINTVGLVLAWTGADGGRGYAPGAPIGSGGCYGGGCYSSVIDVKYLPQPTASPAQGGEVFGILMGSNSPASGYGGVAVGSRMTWLAKPNPGYRYSSRTAPLVFEKMDGSSAYLYQDINSTTGSVTPTVTFIKAPTLSISAPTSVTRPGSFSLQAQLLDAGTPVSGKTVNFYGSSGNLIGSGTTASNGWASVTVTSPAVNSYSYYAVFDGDTTYGSITSSTVSVNVVRADATVTIEATPAGKQTRPGNVTITATMKTGSTAVASQSLPLYVNGVLAANATTNAQGVATFTLAAPPVGTYSYQVKSAQTSTYKAADSNTIANYQVVRDSQSIPLVLSGLDSVYTYGDAPLALTSSGGSGTGNVTLASSNPTVASLSDTTTDGAGTLTLNRSGTFAITQTKAEDTTYNELVQVSPTTTVIEATPVATLTRTGGETFDTPVNATLVVNARGTGTTPVGLVQFYQRNKKLGDPLPLVDNSDGTASVSLNNIPLTHMGAEIVTAVFLGEPGKYKAVTKNDEWYLGNMSYCIVELPQE